MSTHRAGLVVGLVVALSGSAGAQDASSGMSEVAGLYTIQLVNKKQIPSQTWRRTASDTTCTTATQEGTLMLDSKGRWAMLVRERDRCSRGSKHWTSADMSTLSTGTYTGEGDTLTLTDAVTGTAHTAVVGTTRLTLTVSGSDPFGGQTATYVLRRQRATRGR